MKITVRVTELIRKELVVDADNNIQAVMKALSIWKEGQVKIESEDKSVKAEVV